VTESAEFPKVITLILELSRYPLLAPRIRERMRQELFNRGVITEAAFEAEVEEKSAQSQIHEGLEESGREAYEAWQTRQTIVRDNLTDFYFGYNLPHDLFEDLVRETLAKRGSAEDVVLTFHPELAPWDMLFAQGEAFEALAEPEREKVEHHLMEIKVVLIKAMMSDHLDYVGIAKRWLTIGNLRAVRDRRIGRGKIGGKASGIELARCILQQSADDDLRHVLRVPQSWFLGADVFYGFTDYNNLLGFSNQKYLSEEEIREDYSAIRAEFQQGRFPDEIVDGLRQILEELGSAPVIVRSSSLLEDSFAFSFAGKYESHFCPNQGTPKQNLRALIGAISNVYASVYSPDALLYRKSKGLIDYDERMAVLIQEVQGRKSGNYYMPDAAGVAFSRNQYRWSPRIERSAGFMRMVWGLGTRAVEKVGEDHPRLVALSHPHLRPDSDPRMIKQYSQRAVDLIDLASNELSTLPVREVIHADTPHLRLIAQKFEDDQVEDFVAHPLRLDRSNVVLSFKNLLGKTEFPNLMRTMLSILESHYERPVDVEFLLLLEGDDISHPGSEIHLLQCRPQSQLESEAVELPDDIPAEKTLFVCRQLVPDGLLSEIRYVVYVSPKDYRALPDNAQRVSVARLVGRINRQLKDDKFILMGPGRWGSKNSELGVSVSYSDIYNSSAIIEIPGPETSSEPSYGTHFFQDLVESQIYPLALPAEDERQDFNRSFFEDSESVFDQILPEDAKWAEVVRILDVPALAAGQNLRLVMNGEAGIAIAYLAYPGL
jgi:hypothetical protein